MCRTGCAPWRWISVASPSRLPPSCASCTRRTTACRSSNLSWSTCTTWADVTASSRDCRGSHSWTDLMPGGGHEDEHDDPLVQLPTRGEKTHLLAFFPMNLSLSTSSICPCWSVQTRGNGVTALPRGGAVHWKLMKLFCVWRSRRGLQACIKTRGIFPLYLSGQMDCF